MPNQATLERGAAERKQLDTALADRAAAAPTPATPPDHPVSATSDPSVPPTDTPVAQNGRKGRKNVKDALALALAGGSTVEQAATKAGVSPRTVYRRLADRAFRQAVADLRGEMVNRAAGRLANRMSQAAQTLQKLLKAESETVRLGAARSILEMATRLREQLEIDARLRLLEERLLPPK